MRRLALLAAAAAAALLPFAELHGQAEWAVDRKPILDLTGVTAGGAVNFENVAGVTRLHDGSLLIADRGPNSVRLFDPTGKLVKTVGRTGDGPGEFQTMLWAGGCGPDSMLVWDPRKGQASIVTSNGSVARTFRIPADSGSRVRGPLNMIACGARGTIAYISDPTGRVSSATQGVFSMLASIVTVSAEGKVLSHIDSVPSGEFVALGRGGGGPRPLGIAAYIVVLGDRTIVGLSDSARVSVLDPAGKKSSVRLPVQSRAPTRDEFDAAVASIGQMVPAPLKQGIVDQLSKTTPPALAPTFFGLFSDPVGLLWVQTSPAGAKQATLLAVQPDGRVVARVQLPVPLVVSEIGRDFILGTYSDDSDELHVVVLRLNRK